MPAQKRSASEAILHNPDEQEEDNESSQNQPQHFHQQDVQQSQQQRNPDDDDDDDCQDQAEQDEPQDSEESSSPSSSSSSGEKPEFVFVELSEIRKDVQCPICLGIIKKTRTVMECLHRFCRECIDKSMRLGNNECPACRTHCASRRSLRDDPNYDALIAALYPDIDKYEEEELAFHEEERNRNKQIQASIAQVLQKQSEALVKRRSLGKDASGGFMTRSQRNLRNSRRRRSCRGTEVQASEDNDDENNGGKDSSSNDERCTDVKPRKYKRRIGRPSQASSSAAAKSEGGCSGNDSEAKRDNRGISPSLVWSPEMLAWGGGGARSHTRHGNNSGCNSKSSRSSRISKLVDHLRNLNENSDEVHVKVLLVSVNEQYMPSLQQPYIYCQANLSIKHLCEYVARQTSLQSEEVEMLVVRTPPMYSSLANSLNSLPAVDLCNSELLKLEEEERLAGIRANYISTRDHLILAYRQKETAH